MATGSVRLIDRVMRILSFLAGNPGGVGVAELAAAIDLPAATVYRILATLCAHRAVCRVAKGRYQIGPAVLSWANDYIRKTGISNASELLIERLWKETGETVNLLYLEGWRLYFIKRLQSPQPISTSCKVGGELGLYSSSAGRAVLAAFTDREIRHYLETVELLPLTGRTIVDPQKLWAKIMQARELGFGEENEENEVGIRCVGAAILDAGGKPAGAVSLTIPAFRMDDGKVDIFGRKVVETARAISADMGWKPG